MLILNPTDRTIQFQYSLRPPRVANAEEAYAMPQGFELAPKSVTEVPDKAGDYACEYYGDIGVRRLAFGEEADMAIRNGRRVWLQHVTRQVEMWQREQAAAMARGMAPQIAKPHILELAQLKARLEKEFADELAELMGGKAMQDDLVRKAVEELQPGSMQRTFDTQRLTNDFGLAQKVADAAKQAAAGA